MANTTTPAASPATIKQLVEQAQTALADVFFRLELLTNNREHEISTLANQTLSDLRAVLNTHDAMERWCWSQDAQGASNSTAAPAPTPPAPEQDESDEDEAVAAYHDALKRSNQFLCDSAVDTLGRVVGGLALLSCVDDSDHDEDASTGKLHLIESMRCALEIEAQRLGADQSQEAPA